jgi:biotin synthase
LPICTHHDASVRADDVVIRIEKARRTCGGMVGVGEQVGDRLGMLMLPTFRFTPKAFRSTQGMRSRAFPPTTPPSAPIRSAGHPYMTDELQTLCFVAGANSIFIGDVLLTTRNPQTDRDTMLLGRPGMTSKLDDASPAQVQIAVQAGVQAPI